MLTILSLIYLLYITGNFVSLLFFAFVTLQRTLTHPTRRAPFDNDALRCVYIYCTLFLQSHNENRNSCVSRFLVSNENTEIWSSEIDLLFLLYRMS